MTSRKGSSPNVIVVFTDQQRWDTTGVHGNPLGLTPHFDRMTRSGTHLFNFFTCQPVCGPARAALQTGLYPTTTGCYRNQIPLGPAYKTLAHHFRAAGYQTAYIGKWHLAKRDPVPTNERGGYESWLASNLLEFRSDAYNTVLYDEGGKPVRLPGYRVDALTDAAIRYIDRHNAMPFYLFLSFLEPHHQNHLDAYPAPDGYAERYTGAWMPPDLAALIGTAPQHLPGYYGMIKRIDEALGRLTDALKSLGLVDDTILLFTSDHGCHFKTRNAEYKRSCHDASIRVPAALHGSCFEGGGLIDAPISSIDLPPTLLDACGLPVPTEMQGHSVLPLLHSRHAPWPDEVFVQISESQIGRAIRTRRWKYSVSAPEGDGWRDPAAKRYVEEFLYDLDADPYELTNLAGLKPFRATADELRERLIARMTEAGEVAPAIELASPHPGGQRRRSVGDA